MQERITFSDRSTIGLEVKQGLQVIHSRGSATERVVLPYPRAGFGGHGFVVSARESYLALHLYSGQSEEGYELFTLKPKLSHLGGLPYVGGEGASLLFSDDEKWFAFALATDPHFGADEDLDPASPVPWLELRAQELPGGSIATCEVSLEVAPGCVPKDESYYPRVTEFPSSARLVVESPWGARLTVAVPLPTSASLPYFD